jgi:hypothetical protein
MWYTQPPTLLPQWPGPLLLVHAATFFKLAEGHLGKTQEVGVQIQYILTPVHGIWNNICHATPSGLAIRLTETWLPWYPGRTGANGFLQDYLIFPSLNNRTTTTTTTTSIRVHTMWKLGPVLTSSHNKNDNMIIWAARDVSGQRSSARAAGCLSHCEQPAQCHDRQHCVTESSYYRYDCAVYVHRTYRSQR